MDGLAVNLEKRMNVAQLIEDLKKYNVSPAECEDAADFIESLLSQAKQREGIISELKTAGRELVNWYRYTYQNEPSEHIEHPFVILNNMTAN